MAPAGFRGEAPIPPPRCGYAVPLLAPLDYKIGEEVLLLLMRTVRNGPVFSMGVTFPKCPHCDRHQGIDEPS